MGKLIDRLPLPEKRDELVDECCGLLEEQVSKKKGIRGFAVKTGFTLLKSIKPGVVREIIDGLLDDFIEALDELYQQQQNNASKQSFTDFMKANPHQIAEQLVGVTDRRAEKSRNTALKKGYEKLRGHAVHSVEEAVPSLADLLDRHYKNQRPSP